MLLSDSQIASLAREQGMIEPFQPSLIRRVGAAFYGPREHETYPVLSYGCSSYGYDLRLSSKEFLIFRHIPGTIIDPKNFNPANLESVELHKDSNGEFFILPAHSYGLGVAVEKLQMPPNVTGLCLGKSTYARTGLIVNATPTEAMWRGHLTLEFSNSCGADVRLYANEGVCQILFLQGEPCSVTYGDRAGKYQNQPESVTLPRI
jgi:dCTP deaminase